MDQSTPVFDHEGIYDDQIAPLMTQVIDICKANGIPFLCTFVYAQNPSENDCRYCTSALVFDHSPLALQLACGLIKSEG